MNEVFETKKDKINFALSLAIVILLCLIAYFIYTCLCNKKYHDKKKEEQKENMVAANSMIGNNTGAYNYRAPGGAMRFSEFSSTNQAGYGLGYNRDLQALSGLAAERMVASRGNPQFWQSTNMIDNVKKSAYELDKKDMANEDPVVAAEQQAAVESLTSRLDFDANAAGKILDAGLISNLY